MEAATDEYVSSEGSVTLDSRCVNDEERQRKLWCKGYSVINVPTMRHRPYIDLILGENVASVQVQPITV